MEGRITDRAMAVATAEAPSLAEVERVICDLQSSNWIQSSMNLIGYGTDLSGSSSSGSAQSRVFDVFQLLQTSSIRKMVVSVATDKAVWEAIMANKEVSALTNSFTRFLAIGEGKEKGNGKGRRNGKERDLIMLLFEWVQGVGKAILDDFIKRFNMFLDKIFIPSNNNKNQQPQALNFILRSTYSLSCIISFIVVVTRAFEL